MTKLHPLARNPPPALTIPHRYWPHATDPKMNALRQTAVAVALAPALLAGAQQKHVASLAPARDATWAKLYATTCQPAVKQCPPSTNGYENDFTWDKRLPALLRASFPQHQSFWQDQERSTSVPNLVLEFIGVPGSLLVDQDRYVTANGCVPHVCEYRGILWIDTARHPAQLIFVAAGDENMLWIFSSTRLNGKQLPQPFLASFHRWRDQLIQFDSQGHSSSTYLDDFLAANLVQPNGEIVTLSPSALGLQSPLPGAKQ